MQEAALVALFLAVLYCSQMALAVLFTAAGLLLWYSITTLWWKT